MPLNKYAASFVLALCATTDYAAELVSQSKSECNNATQQFDFQVNQDAFNRSLELRKLDLERQKFIIAGLALSVPLLAAAMTFALGLWSQSNQAKLQFELKAAEVVLNSNGPVSAANRARALKVMFPNRLPKDFDSAFNKSTFSGPEVEFFEARKLLFEAAVKTGADVNAVKALWRQIFPWQEWPASLGDPLNLPPKA